MRKMFRQHISEHVKSLFDDECDYKNLVLDNGIKVILISSSRFTKSGAAIDIQIGSMHDPHENRGLAHLLEHVIVREMYRNTIISDIIEEDGGEISALTGADHTTYYFRGLRIYPTLQIFAQLIFQPIFDESIIAGELKALHSEYVIRSSTDSSRLDELLYSNWHVYRLASEFKAGNMNTLLYTTEHGVTIRTKLWRFHKLFYSTNVISLCVYAKVKDMQTFEFLVKYCFSMKTKKENRILPQSSSYDMKLIDDPSSKWLIVPTAYRRNMIIYFPLPINYDELESKPAYYIIYLLKHRGRGSLLSSLINKCWCTSIDCYDLYYSAERIYLVLQLDLTKQGLKHVDSIILMLFQYLELLRESGPSNEIYEEYSTRHNINKPLRVNLMHNEFIYIAHYMNRYPLEDVLEKAYRYKTFPGNEISKILRNSILPDYINACILAKECEDEADDRTPWMGTKYSKQAISNDIMSKWSNIKEINKDFQLLAINDYKWNLEMEYRTKIISNKLNDWPVRVRETDKLRIWLSSRPQQYFQIYFQFTYRVAYQSPMGYNLSNIFALLLQDSITECIYPAELVGISCQFQSNTHGISLSISNYRYDEKLLTKLLIPIILRIYDIRVDKNRFEILKEKYVTSLKDLMSVAPDELALYYLEIILTQQIWAYKDLIQNVEDVTVNIMLEFIKNFGNNMFVECLICGNVTDDEVTQLITIFEVAFKDIHSLSKQTSVARDVILQKGDDFLFEEKTNYHKSSCTMVYYQIGLYSSINTDIKCGALLRIIWTIIQRCSMEELRYKEHLGYTVTAGMIKMNDTCGLLISVTGHAYETEYVESRINNFMLLMLNKMRGMSKELFEAYKIQSYSYYKTRSSIAAKFYSNDVYWQEIVSKDHIFNRTYLEKKYLKNSTLDEVCELFQEMINTESHRKLSIHIKRKLLDAVEARQIKMRDDEEAIPDINNTIEERKTEKIDDITSFKKEQLSKQLNSSLPKKIHKCIIS